MEYPDIENAITVHLPVVRPYGLDNLDDLKNAFLTRDPVYAGFSFGSGSLTDECVTLRIVDVEEYYEVIFIVGEFTNTKGARHLRNLMIEGRGIELVVYGSIDLRPDTDERIIVDFVDVRVTREGE